MRRFALPALCCVLTACAATYPVGTPPPVPPARAETISLPPVSATPLIWQPGHYDWTGGAYVWTPGHWVERAGHGTLWQDGYWTYGNGQWNWIPGHWT